MYDPKELTLLLKLLHMDKTLALHHGYFEKGIYSHVKAIQNMNEHVEKLITLNLSDKKTKFILDAGCGIGGTVIYLAKKYSNMKFIGITINSDHVSLAIRFAKENNVEKNTQFLLMDYLNTGFPSCYFDTIFALESLDFTNKKRDFVREMHRILKPHGKLIVISAFQTDIHLNSLLKNIKNLHFKGSKSPSYITVKEFHSLLEKEGFKDIKIRNIYKNVKRSIIEGFILNFLIYLFSIIKNILFPKKETEELYFSKKIYIVDVILFIKKFITYCIVTTIKK